MGIKTRGRGDRGFVTVYVVLASMLLIPVVGLAIDCSVLYTVKARLQAAVDAAAIGSGYMLQRTTDLTDTTQVANIKDAAQRYFNANYPSTFWGSSKVYYDSTPSEDSTTKIRTVYVHAKMNVPMLFLRVAGIPNSQVAAQSTVKVRFVAMMIIVDRSGSVVNGGAAGDIQDALHQFVADSSTSVFVNNRDYVGMVSFGGNYKLDYAPKINFQSSPSIGTAIDNLPFDTASSTNTAEGLYQAWYQLKKLNQVGALNAIVLLTDGRPSAFTGQFTVASGSSCNSKTVKSGVIAANVGSSAAQWPPPTTSSSSGISSFGLLQTVWSCLGCEQTKIITNSTGCAFASNIKNIDSDIPQIPATAGSVDTPDGTISSPTFYNTTSGYSQALGGGMNSDSPRAVRYGAFNVADNLATAIRSDTTYHPVMFVIGLNESSGEPLDADWLARLANDPSYTSTGGASVYQTGQSSGIYYNVSTSGLGAAFQNIASQLLRLSQ